MCPEHIIIIKFLDYLHKYFEAPWCTTQVYSLGTSIFIWEASFSLFQFLALLSIGLKQRQHHDSCYVGYTVCWSCCSSCRISDWKLADSLWSLCCEYVLVTSARPVLEQIPKDKQTMAVSESRQTFCEFYSVPHVPNSQHRFQSKSRLQITLQWWNRKHG